MASSVGIRVSVSLSFLSKMLGLLPTELNAGMRVSFCEVLDRLLGLRVMLAIDQIIHLQYLQHFYIIFL